jgi:SAM-dependent methyltransferase
MMATSQQDFVAAHYATRAETYVDSLVHRTGDDLAQIAARLDGAGIGRALDLGCGGGHVSYCAAPHVGEVVACDVTAAMLAVVARNAAARGLANVAVRQAAAERLPFADGEFGAVLCRYSAHHWQDFEAGLREARRVLKPGGLALFVDAVAMPDRLLDTHLQSVELLRDPSHVRNATAAEWVAGLARAGFAVVVLTPRRLRMEFPVWIARTAAPALHAEAIRSLQEGAAPAVRRHFAIGADGSFDLDTLTLECVAP